MPTELKRDGKRLPELKSKSAVKAKLPRKRIEDPNKILAKLEEKEKIESEGEGAGGQLIANCLFLLDQISRYPALYTFFVDGKEDEDDEKDKTDDEEKVEVEEDIEDIDEEMDEGTDYARDYIDNGEGYLDEDDNLDDGEAQF